MSSSGTLSIDTVTRAALTDRIDDGVDDYVRTITRYRRAVLGMTVVAVALIYIMSALTYGRTLRSTPTPVGFHAAAADALLDGNAALYPAPPELLELSDPYDPVANSAFRSAGGHDLALYDGNLYTATGPTTAVLLHIPSRLLGLGNLNPNTATLVAAFGGFLAAVALFAEIRRRFFPHLSLWAETVAVVGLGLGSPALWLVAIGRGYETAIACGYFLLVGGAFCLLRALRDPAQPIGWLLAVGGVALAAAAGARPTLAAGVLFVAVAAIVVVRAVSHDRAIAARRLIWLVVPYVVIGTLVALYNFVRFDSFTEFGTTYQLAGMNMPRYPAYDAGYLLPNLVDYLVLRPRFFANWPFIYLRENTFVGDPTTHGREPVAGVMLLYPLIPVGLVLAATRARAMWVERRELAWLAILGVAFSLAALLAIALPFNASTMRYTVDFAPVLAMVAAIAWAWSFERARRNRSAARALAGVWLGATAFSVIAGIALVLTPCPGTGSC